MPNEAASQLALFARRGVKGSRPLAGSGAEPRNIPKIQEVLPLGPRKGACPKKAHRSARKSVATAPSLGRVWISYTQNLGFL